VVPAGRAPLGREVRYVGRPGRPWALTLPDRVLLVAVYWRTNLTMRQIGPLFGVSHSAAYRAIDTLGPLFALAPVRRRPQDQVAIVDGTLIPTRDHQLARKSKNHRYSATCKSPSTPTPVWSSPWATRNRAPQRHDRLPHQRHRPEGGRARRDGRYRGELPAWKQDYNTGHRKIRARVEHALARLKTCRILRDYRRAGRTLAVTASGTAHLHNIALAD
jgi:hypothetical protein